MSKNLATILARTMISGPQTKYRWHEATISTPALRRRDNRRNVHSEAKAMRTRILAKVYGPQSNKSNAIQQNSNFHTTGLVEAEGFKAIRSALVRDLLLTHWPATKIDQVLVDFSKLYQPQAL